MIANEKTKNTITKNSPKIVYVKIRQHGWIIKSRNEEKLLPC